MFKNIFKVKVIYWFILKSIYKYVHSCIKTYTLKNIFVYQKAWIQYFTPVFLLQNNLCEFTAWEHKFKRWLCTQKPILNICDKEFWKPKTIFFTKFQKSILLLVLKRKKIALLLICRTIDTKIKSTLLLNFIPNN